MTTTPKKRGRPAKNPIEPVSPATPTEDRVAPYVIELRIGGALITNSGTTMLEALEGLQKPTKIITKATVKVFHGDQSKELFMMPLQLKRMFYPLAKVTQAKILAMNI